MINVLFTCDENYAIFLNVAIVSILKNAKKDDLFKFFVMGPDLSKKTQDDILKFKKIHNFDIKFITINLEEELNFYSAEGVWKSKLCFLRIKAPLILERLGYKIDKLLYLDADIIVQKSISDLFLIDLKNYEIATVASPIAEEEKEHFPKLNISSTHKYFYSGLLLIDVRKYIDNKIYEKSINIFNREHKKFLWPDMDLLNLTLENNCLILDPKYSLNPLFNYEPFTHKLENYYRIYNGVYSEVDVKNAFLNTIIYQLAGGAKPYSPVSNFMTVLLFYKYAKLTVFKKQALGFLIKKIKNYLFNKKGEKNMKKLHGLRKRWYMLRDLLGVPSKKYNYKNNYIKDKAIEIEIPYELILKEENNNLSKLFNELNIGKTIVNNKEIKFLTGVNAMYGVTENSLNFLIEYLKKNPKNNKLLSVGCGLLDQIKILKAAGFDVCGVDIDIKDNTDKLKFHDLNEYNTLPFEKEEFDFVLCQEVIEHIENPWLLFRKIKAVLKKDGILVLTTPNILSRNSKNYFLNSKFGFSESFNEESIWQHINPLPFWEIMHIANYNHFDLLELSNNMEYYFDYKIKNHYSEDRQSLTLDSGQVLHYVFINKDNEIKSYIPDSTYEVSMKILNNKNK